MRISKNFNLDELLHSDLAERHNIENVPQGDDQLASLVVLTHKVLQPTRDKFGVVTVTSGLRVLELNRLCKSSDRSQHVAGEAADFKCFSTSNLEVASWIRDNLDFDQLILEFYKPPNGGWVHCSYRKSGDNRKEVLTFKRVKGETVKEEGLPDG